MAATNDDHAYEIFLRLPDEEKQVVWDSMTGDTLLTEPEIAMATARCADRLPSLNRTDPLSEADRAILNNCTALDSGENDKGFLGVVEAMGTMSEDGRARLTAIVDRQYLASLAEGTLRP